MTVSDTALPAFLEDDRFGIDTIGGIRALLHGYSGGISILRELAQNADDAPGAGDRWLELHFFADRLVVRNNSVFRSEDFERIKRIAAGGKLNDQHRTTGTFGVGFVSVYQLTDTPILRSAGYELRFDPHEGRAPAEECAVDDMTEFELPLRLEPTPVGRALSMDPVTRSWVRNLLDDQLPVELPLMLLFTERLTRISVYEDDQLLLEVRRSMEPPHVGRVNRIIIDYVHGARRSTHQWLRFVDKVEQPSPRRQDGRAEKDPTVHIAVPCQDVPVAYWQERGRLFNYQPTNITTRLPFHINGDFYPSTDRKNIDDGHDSHRRWNRAVLATIGHCFGQILPTIQRKFALEPEAFYQRLPLTALKLRREQELEATLDDLIGPLLDTSLRSAAVFPIFYTPAGWKTAQDARWVKQALRLLAEQADQHLIPAALQAAAWELISQLKVAEYTLDHHLNRIRNEVPPGTKLAQGPAHLRTPEQVEMLYQICEQELEQQSISETDITNTPMFLDQHGRLWSATRTRRARTSQQQECYGDAGVLFWAGSQDRYLRISRLIAEVQLADLWAALVRILPPAPFALRDGPDWLNTRQKLYRLYDAILQSGETIQSEDVINVPIFLDRADRLNCPVDLAIPDGEPRLYKIISEEANLRLAAPAVADNRVYRGLYLDCGIQAFGLSQLLAYLETISPMSDNAIALEAVHPALNSREKLTQIYHYLRDHREEFDNQIRDKLRQRLQIWLCRDNYLHLATNLRLPPDVEDWPQFLSIDRVMPFERRDNLHPLLEKALGIVALDAAGVIERYLCPQYAGLERNQQIESLKYLRTQVELLRTDRVLRQKVQDTPLILGADNNLHRAVDVCFPESRLHEIFPGACQLPHQIFFGGAKDVGQWTELFRILGVNQVARPEMVLRVVDELRAQTPAQNGKRIEKIFRYLEGLWSEHYQMTELGPRLRDRAWLPADGDSNKWYRPSELYARTDKPLVDQVALLLGFTSPQRPQQAIADAMGFPTRDVHIAVRQLRRLSELNKPPEDFLYRFLRDRNATEAELKPLKDLPVIYDRGQQRFWRADQVFLRDLCHDFGSYRCYAPQTQLYELLRRLGAREAPVPKDYLELIREISAQFHTQTLPDTEIGLLLNAYDRLADAPQELLEVLRDLACVVSQTQDSETRELRLPYAVLLQPPDKYGRHLPTLPRAVYNPNGESTLSKIGVRRIEQVLQTDFPFMPQREHLRPLSKYLGSQWLRHAIRRILHHYHESSRSDAILSQLDQLKAYDQSPIRIQYRVKLGSEVHESGMLNLDSYYDMNDNQLYLLKGLSQVRLEHELAAMLREVLHLEHISFAVLKDLLNDPGETQRILDDENIHPLPVPPELQTPDMSSLVTDIGGIISDDADEPTSTNEDLFDAEPPVPGADNQPHSSTSMTDAKPGEPESNAGEQPTRSDMEHKAQRSNPRSTERSGTSKKEPQPDRNSPRRPPANRPRPPASDAVIPPGKTALAEPSPITAPRFRGRTNHASPSVPTDWDGLRERVESWAQQQQHSPSEQAHLNGNTQPTGSRRTSRVVEPVARDHARFVLSFPEYSNGFLRLRKDQVGIFEGRPRQVSCTTDFHQQFPLWLDWGRNPPIAYNQDALTDFFLNQGIPAGGVVYLERIHVNSYRLFYKRDPHDVLEVRLAMNDAGSVQYEVIEKQHVECETDEAVLRAEKRHEDPGALWLEAVGKKSVEETLCDLLIAAPGGWIHETELKALVESQRMLAADTVDRTLHGKSYFVSDGHGNWRLDAAAFLSAPQHLPVQQWVKSSEKLIDSNDDVLANVVEHVYPVLSRLQNRFKVVLQQTATDTDQHDLTDLVKTLMDDPENTRAMAELQQSVMQYAEAADIASADLALQTLLNNVEDELLWSNVLRPILRDVIKRLQERDDYQRAAQIGVLWSTADSHCTQDLAHNRQLAEAWELIQGRNPSIAHILKALEIAPTLRSAPDLLHEAVQRELGTRTAAEWQAEGAEILYLSVIELLPARRQLTRKHREAFDHTVEAIVKEIWGTSSAPDKILLGLTLAEDVGYRIPDWCTIDLLKMVQDAAKSRDFINAFALGQTLWPNVSGKEQQSRLADTLARCCDGFQFWEWVNNKPWYASVSVALKEEVRKKWQQNAASAIQRAQRLLATICSADKDALAQALAVPRNRFASDVEKDVQKMLNSAA